MADKHVERLLAAARIPARYAHCSFGSFELHHASHRRALESARRVARLAPLAVAGMKELVREAPDDDAVTAAMHRCAHSEDVREGLAAMREKRPAKFSGR